MIRGIEEDKDEVTGDAVVNMLQDNFEKKTLIEVIGLESRAEEWKGQYSDPIKLTQIKKHEKVTQFV